MRSRCVRGWLCLLSLVAVASPIGAGAPASFTDRTEPAGVAGTHSPAPDHPSGPMSAGGTVGDFNNDGRPDLFVLGGGNLPDRLFINQGNGSFVDEAWSWGVDALHRGSGATAADYDGDGWMDLFVTSMGETVAPASPGRHRLYRNNGNNTFTNVAQQAGVAATAPYPDGYGATFGDYDLDGDLDLFVGGWHLNMDPVPDPWDWYWNRLYASEGNRLFRNDGDGTFTDVTISAGLYLTPEVLFGFGAIFADMNGDRYPELLVAGDFGSTRYFINNRNGTFSEHEFLAPGGELAHNGMGTTVGDFNRDGRLDWFVTAIYPAWKYEGPPGNRLYYNQGSHSFVSSPESLGVNDGGWGWGTSAIDVDHDGWLDIAMTNGWPNTDPVTQATFTDEPSYLFLNQGNGTFAEVGQAVGFDHTLQGRGLVHLDYDSDGDMDIAVFSNGEEIYLFRNEVTGPEASWLQVRLDSSGNPALAPHGLGSDVQVTVDGATQYQRMAGGSNYLGRSQLIAHFGLSDADLVDELRVRWPDGFDTVLRNVAANQVLELDATRPYSHGPLVRGSNVDLVVHGAQPGETVYWFYSLVGTGTGPCFNSLGGMCIDLVLPAVFGSAVADAEGTAVLNAHVPWLLWWPVMHTQAVVPRGPEGLHSAKTNAISAPILWGVGEIQPEM